MEYRLSLLGLSMGVGKDGHDYEGDLVVALLIHTFCKTHTKLHTIHTPSAHKTDKSSNPVDHSNDQYLFPDFDMIL